MHHECDLFVLLLLLLCFPHLRGDVALLTQLQGGWRVPDGGQRSARTCGEVGRVVGKGRRAWLLTPAAAAPARHQLQPLGAGQGPASAGCAAVLL